MFVFARAVILLSLVATNFICSFHFTKTPLRNGRHLFATKFRSSLEAQSKQNSFQQQPNPTNKQISDIQNEKSRRSRKTTHRKGQYSRSSSTKEDSLVGRVSVYCVGSGIDLAALRAHVFRRGFGNAFPVNDSVRPPLTLARRVEDPELDDQVVHVTNAPLFITADNRIATIVKDSNKDRDQIAILGGKGGDEMDESEGFLAASESPGAPSPAVSELVAMHTQNIFYFAFGVVVMWGLTSAEEKAALTELSLFTLDPVTPVELENSFDTMEYTFDPTVPTQQVKGLIKFDLVRLHSLCVEEKLAVSYAMAQSSKLFVFEAQVLQSVERTRYLPRTLAREGKIALTKRDLNRLIGQLFVEQTEVNLFSSILDTPDFLWEDDEYSSSYQATRHYLEVDTRVTLLNSRLSVIRELLDVLNAQVADNNSTRLEWTMIWLIIIEILMGIVTGPLFVRRQLVAGLVAGVIIPAAVLLYQKYGNH